MRSAADFDTPNSGASWRRVRLVRQYAVTSRTPVLQRQRPRPALADRVGSLTPQRSDQLGELPRAQPGDRGYPGRLRRRDHTSHDKIISPAASSYGTTSRLGLFVGLSLGDGLARLRVAPSRATTIMLHQFLWQAVYHRACPPDLHGGGTSHGAVAAAAHTPKGIDTACWRAPPATAEPGQRAAVG